LTEESSWQIGLERILLQFGSGLLVQAEIQMKGFEAGTTVAQLLDTFLTFNHTVVSSLLTIPGIDAVITGPLNAFRGDPFGGGKYSRRRRQDIGPDVFKHTAALSACERGQQCQQALHLLRVMQHHGRGQEVITHEAAVRRREKGQQCQRALCLIRARQLHDFVPDGITPRAAIRACETGQQCQLALHI